MAPNTSHLRLKLQCCVARMRYALVSLILVFFALWGGLSLVGLRGPFAAFWAVLGAGLLAALAYRERAFLRHFEDLELQHIRELEQVTGRLDFLYANSSVALVRFHPNTLKLMCASEGFFSLFELRDSASSLDVSLADLGGLDAEQLRAAVEHIRHRSARCCSVFHVVSRRDYELPLHMSGVYLQDADLIEASFTIPPMAVRRAVPLAAATEDLQRLHRGMLRREQRILELKSEVNEVLVRYEQRARYQIDLSSTDSELKARSSSASVRVD